MADWTPWRTSWPASPIDNGWSARTNTTRWRLAILRGGPVLNRSMTRPWDEIISADEIARYEAAGFGRPTGMGTRPALLIIDVQYRTVGLERRPYWEAIEEFK